MVMFMWTDEFEMPSSDISKKQMLYNADMFKHNHHKFVFSVAGLPQKGS